ncbi:hypothetical protein GCM10023321_73210 [Pseudonocardia eucalypti]|uniref:Cyclic nucleotide-binding domain-containing protein n=1 Tax=Pseudonocardia eucalypti TaxID=648755 RepID=A0ABP9R7V1_9PSEU
MAGPQLVWCGASRAGKEGLDHGEGSFGVGQYANDALHVHRVGVLDVLGQELDVVLPGVQPGPHLTEARGQQPGERGLGVIAPPRVGVLAGECPVDHLLQRPACLLGGTFQDVALGEPGDQHFVVVGGEQVDEVSGAEAGRGEQVGELGVAVVGVERRAPVVPQPARADLAEVVVRLDSVLLAQVGAQLGERGQHGGRELDRPAVFTERDGEHPARPGAWLGLAAQDRFQPGDQGGAFFGA